MQHLSDTNRLALEVAAVALGEMRRELVFVGGAAVGLLITDPAAPPVRVTKDVDCIVEVATQAEYFGRIRDQLLELGFTEMQGEGVPICAWTIQGVRLDVMPTEEAILGFSNPWYSKAARRADFFDLGTIQIRVIRPEYFVATKFAAFSSRGNSDYLASHDIEDLIAVIDGRPTICDEVDRAEPAIRDHISQISSTLLANSDFQNALPGHLVDPGRERIVIDRLRSIAELPETRIRSR